MKVDKIIIGDRYNLSGDINNGHDKDGNPVITQEKVTREVIRITKTHVICKCGSKFLINDNLKITDIHTGREI